MGRPAFKLFESILMASIDSNTPLSQASLNPFWQRHDALETLTSDFIEEY
jgi:hypothetical protein